MSTYSDEHKLFLKKFKKNKLIVNISRIAILLIFLVGWEIFAKYKLINTFLTSCPSEIINTTISLIKDGSLFNHIGITLYEIFITFIVSFTLSMLIATLMWIVPTFSKIIDPYLTVLNSLPKVALGPLIIIWAGSGSKSIILMGLLISIFVTTINIYSGFSSTDNKYIILLKSFGANRLKVFFKVVIPSNISNIISALKVNISMDYIGVVMGELLVSKIGLGYLIMYGSSVFHIDLVITSVFILCLLSYIMYFLVELLEKHFKKNIA